MKKIPLLIDMDDVVVKTSEAALKKYAIHRGCEVPVSSDYFWNDVPHTTKGYWEEMLNTPGFFRNLEPEKDAIDVLNKLHEEGYEIIFLTAPQKNQYCFMEKIEWLEEHLEWFEFEKHFIATWNKSHVYGILLDDNMKNLENYKGHMAVAFDRPFNQGWESVRVKDWKEYYIFVHYKNIEDRCRWIL